MQKTKLTLIIILLAIIAFSAYQIWQGNRGSSGVSVVTIGIKYMNTDYGFSVSLPDSWKGYSTVSDKWEGYGLVDSGDRQVLIATGTLVYIRHPDWTEASPRQDIPVMIFTLKQWDDQLQDKFHIGAAPIGPSELGRNSRYVFALPARYNFAFRTGFEEVEQIIKGGALRAF